MVPIARTYFDPGQRKKIVDRWLDDDAKRREWLAQAGQWLTAAFAQIRF